MKAQDGERKTKAHPKPNEAVPSASDIEAYIADLLTELAKMARSIKRDRLAHLLTLAVEEARRDHDVSNAS